MNVVFVSVDTTRADCLGCYGHPVVKTPNVDRLASEGTRFATCISSCPLTLVSHSTMMTGSYQFVHGARDNGLYQLGDSNVTLAEIFREAGYTTEAEVATVILDKKYGLDQGFESYGEVDRSRPKRSEPRAEDAGAPKATEPPLEPEVEDMHLDRKADEITDRAIELLNQKAAGDKPFFFFLHYYDPHQPFESPERFTSRYIDPYFRELAFFDEQFGRLVDKIRELGLSEKTLLVLTSDHGEGRGQHGEYTHSTFLYDTTQHVPLILWSPGNIPAGKVVETQVRLIDLAPTVVDFTKLQTTPQMQGTSLLPLLADASYRPDLPCYGDTLVPKITYGYSPLRMIRTAEWKYILAPRPELYHVAEDKLELYNLAESEPQRSAELREQLRDLIAGAPAPPGLRATVIQMDEQERKRLEALGYLGSPKAGSADDPLNAAPNELDNFEPVGENPHDHAEVIETLAATMGAFRGEKFEEAELLARRVLELAPDNASALSYLGEALLRLKRLEEAAEVYRRTVQLYPDRWREHRLLGTILAELGQYAEAEASLLKAIELNWADPIAHINLGQLLTLQKRFDEALKQHEEAVDLAPKSLDAHYHLGLCRKFAGKPEEAAAAFREALHIKPTLVAAHLNLAASLRMTGRLDEAIQHLSDAIGVVPDRGSLYQGLADCFLAKGDLDTAGKHLARAVELLPDSSEARFHLGMNLLARGEVDAAERMFAEAVRLDDRLAPAYVQWAEALCRMGRPEEAAERLSAALDILPNRAVLYAALGETYSQLGNTDRAIEHLTCVTDLQPDSADAWIRLGAGLQAAGRDDDAIAAFESATQANPDSADGHLRLASTLRAAGRTDESFTKLQQALERLPNQPFLHHALGEHYESLNDLERAGACFARAVELSPDDAGARRNLAVNLLALGRAEDALEHLRKAVELRPDFVDALGPLGDVLVAMSQQDEAAKVFEKLLALDPRYSRAYPSAAMLMDQQGRPEQAVELLRRGSALLPDDPDIANDLAWRLATSPRSDLRDGAKAVELAERVERRTHGGDVNVLDTLAAAYAEAGRFAEAVATARRAVELARKADAAELATQIASRLSLYEKQQPYREG